MALVCQFEICVILMLTVCMSLTDIIKQKANSTSTIYEIIVEILIDQYYE